MTKYEQLGTEEDDLNGRIREFRTKYCLAIIDVIIYVHLVRYTFLYIIYFIILDQSVPPVEIRISLRFDKKYFARYHFRFVIFSLV